ncbi:MAG TPA: acyclic terpene utilization AtuA family protein [Gemmataceae bacterium]|nr:acyclic terpene utilization AtuA family protein [Gemmataceae bacterium]
MRRVRIGNGCGFWGDNLDAPIRLARDAKLDYLTLEYLAELTMSILALLRQRDPRSGFAHDFLDVLTRLTPSLSKQPNLKIVTNAGGMNPQSCAVRANAILADAGLSNRPVAVVSGDDLLPRLDELISAGHTLANLDTGEPIASVRSRMVSANAYLGARPIVDALNLGASIVITGRVADASLTVAPAVYEHGWAWTDLDRLCSATVAGHLIECGAQATGGLWTNWSAVPDLADVGYPIADIAADGSFRIEKPVGSGGAVNVETIAEQLLYEVGDPAAYLTPDVTADFTTIKLSEPLRNVVGVTPARGKSATDSYKVSVAYRDGYAASGTLVLLGPDAERKGRFAGQILLDRLKAAGVTFPHTLIECLGAGDCVPGVVKATAPPPEVVMRVAVRGPDKAAVERFTKEFAPLVTAGPPGVTGYTTGRPAVREVFAYWPALIAKTAVDPYVNVRLI